MDRRTDGLMDGWTDATWTILLAQLTLSAELKIGSEIRKKSNTGRIAKSLQSICPLKQTNEMRPSVHNSVRWFGSYHLPAAWRVGCSKNNRPYPTWSNDGWTTRDHKSSPRWVIALAPSHTNPWAIVPNLEYKVPIGKTHNQRVRSNCTKARDAIAYQQIWHCSFKLITNIQTFFSLACGGHHTGPDEA
jgi:hypothetical protein